MSLFTETARYLGVRGAADERTAAMIARALREVPDELKYVFYEYPCEVTAEGVSLGGFFFESRDLAKTLAGCERAILLAATLGAAADRRLLCLSQTDMAFATVFDAACTAALEEKLDALDFGVPVTMRFSPGYGDLDIQYQRTVLDLLSAQKRIGLCLTAGGMLAPVKSVTAVLGVKLCEKKSACAACAKADCAYRKR